MTSHVASQDLWSWIDEEPEAEQIEQINPHEVTAILVTHNAAEWLPRQLRALAALNPRPGRLIVVDNGSSDGSRAMLEEAHVMGLVSRLVPGTAEQGFGEAVASAVSKQDRWLWLLHDDSMPRPDALGQLLRGAARTGAAVLVPKLLQPRRRNYPETLAELGQSITPTGRRVGTVEVGDIDQDQEVSQRILGGSTAGMLVRGDAWHQLGGLAPELPLHRDGVDFGWRANEAGYGVITWPDAALTHRQSGRTGERRSALAPDDHEMDRLTALRVVASRGPKPPPMARLVVGSWIRAAGFLLAKSPRRAQAELRAARRFAATQDQVTSLAARTINDRVDLSTLLPSRWWPVRNTFDRLGTDLAERYRDFTTPETGLSIDEMTGDDFAGVPTRRRLLAPLSIMTMVLLVCGVVALRTLLNPGEAFGGGLLPAPTGFLAAWQNALTPMVGAAGSPAPWLGFGAVLSLLSFGYPQLLVLVALALAPLFAGLSAHSFLRQLEVARTTAAVLSGIWAGAVILLGLVTTGDIGGMVLAIALPRLAAAIHRMYWDSSSGAEALRAPAATAWWLLVAAVAWPLMWVLAALGGAVWIWRDRQFLPRILIVVGLPLAFLGPWLPTLWAWPGRILTGPDPMAWPDWPIASLGMIAGRILPSGFPVWVNVAFFALVGVAALYGTIQLASTRARLVVFGLIGIPLVLGLGLSRLAVPVNGGDAHPLISGWALLTLAGLLTPVVLLRLRHEKPRFDVKAVLSGLTVGGLIAASTFAVVGFNSLVTNRGSQLSYVGDVVASARQTRVLLIENTSSGLTWNVVDAAQPRWGTGERNPAGSFHQEFAALVQLFSGGDVPEDLTTQLASLGVSHVWMSGFSADQLAAVGNAAGLSRSLTDDNDVLWTVVDLPSRAQILVGSSAIAVLDGTVEASEIDRQLRLAEPPDGRWTARIGETELTRVEDDSAVIFEIPAGVSGELSWELKPNIAGMTWQIVVVLAIIGLAAPTIGGASGARRGLEE